MKKRLLVLALICAVGIVLLLLNRPRQPAPMANGKMGRPHAANESTGTVQSSRVVANTTNGANAAAPASNALAAAAEMKTSFAAAPNPAAMPEFTNFAASTVLENMRAVFHQYSATYGGNPVGTNPEITKALNGGNPKAIQFINADDGLRINGNGELVDSWGTPFFFHQLSGTQMEIHSAGPDRVMWTADDLVVK